MLLKGKHIFTVEDNSLNKVVFQMSLMVEGARLEFERWGRDTVAKLKVYGDIDLILLDLMLPMGVSGFDIFTEIRGCDEFDTIPIVAVSAYEPSIAIPKAKELGFAGFISKPIDEQLFPQQLHQILMGEQVWYDGVFR